MRQRITPILMSFLFVMGMAITLHAQISVPGTPASIEKNAPNLTVAEVYNTTVDWNIIQQEDDFDRQYGMPPRGGLSIPVGRRITEFGEWMLLPGGDVMWRVKIHSDDAKALGIVFSDFYLPPNTEMYIYDEDKNMTIGAFTSANNHSSGQFSTKILPYSTLVIEYIERGAGVNLQPEKPKPYGQVNPPGYVTLTNYQPQTNFRIDELIYIYVDTYGFLDPSRPATGSSAACQVNINCSPVGDNWQNQKRGVAHIVFREGASWYYCSGTLVNNTLQNGTPYFLTAWHCGGTASAADRNVWQFYFNYERPTCDNSGTPSTSDMMTGCVYRASAPISGGSDFQLVEFNSNMPAGYNPFYNGWDRSAVGATSGASIHHPAGDVKKISTFSAQLTSSTPTISGQTFATNAAWRVVWSANANGWGVTEGGSSGSPIFNQLGRVVGDLSGGSSTCASPTSADFYGKFDYSWESNGPNANQRLRPWLDPAGTNPTFLDGWDPTWVSAPPVADFSGTPTTIMAGQTVQFNDMSTNGPNQWAWTITGAYPATSNERNPQITFITPGQYTVTLTATNGFGSDTETKVNYITVTAYSGTASPITIGTATNSGTYWPLGVSTQGTAGFRYVADVSIYTKAELGNAGVITQLEWNPSTARADSRNIRVYLKHTSDNTLSTSPVSFYTSGATLVYDGTFIPNVAGWFAFALQTHFNYNGIDNLMVITEVNTSGAPGNVPSNCYYTASTARHQQWSGAAAPTGNGTVNGNRPNIRITKNPYTAPVANFAGFDNIIAQDFEDATFPPTGWTVNNVDGAGTTWTSSTSFNHTNGGLRSAVHIYSNAGLQDGYLISTQLISLPAGASLSFWSYNEWPTYYGGTYQGKNSVLISTSGTAPANFTEIWSPATVTASWVQTIIDLSAYAGQNIYIAFRYQGNDAHSWFLDDISVAVYNYTQITTYEGDPVAIYDMSTNNPSVWQWSNPGGIPTTQYNQNADLVYNVAGLYNVSLTAANPAGSNTKTVNNYVNVLGRVPIANFNGVGNLKTVDYRPFIPVGGTVDYTDLSSRVPTSWAWTFNGGAPGTNNSQTPPAITYGSAGTYNTLLQATNSHGTNTMDSVFVFVGGTQYVSNWYPNDNLAVYNYTNGLLPGHAADASGSIYRYAEYFSNAYAGQITNIDLALYRAQGVGKNVTIAVWDGSTGSPGAVLWSTTMVITDFTEGAWNTVPVSPALNVTGSFFVGYQLNYDGTHNYTTHQFCGFMTQFRPVGAPHTAWFSYGNTSPGTWYSFKDGFDIESALLIYPEFTYASVGPIATVSATPGCGTGTVRVTSSENTNQTFNLTDDVGTILDSWTGNAQFRDFTGLANGTYRGQVVVGVQTSPLSAAVVLTNDPTTVGGNVNGVNAEICLGSNTGTLTLSGHTGSVLRWQRQLNGGGWADIAHTATTYSEVPASAGNWEYRAEVQSGSCPSAFSTAFTVLVHPATVAGSVSGVNTEICLGQATGTLTLSGYTGNVLRWQRRYNAGAWTDIANTNNIHSETPGAAGTYEYRAEVRSGTCAAMFSTSYTITVHPVSVGGSVTGTNTEICLGAATGTMTLSGHTGSIVRWERNIDGGGWTTIANTTTTHSETPGTPGSYQYRAVVKSGSCAETFSAAHTITVHPVSVGGTLNGVNTEICLGANTGTMTLSGHTGTVVRWQRRIDGGVWTNIANTTTTHSETPALAGVYDYRVEVRSGNCASVYSTIHTVTVHPASVGGSVTAAATQICLGASTGTLTLSGHTGSIVRWERSVDGGAWQNIVNTTTTHSETPATAGSYQYRAVVKSGSCAETFSATHTITVHPVSVGGTLNGVNTEICLGASTGNMTLSGHTGTVVRWQRRIDGGVWTNIANTTTTHSETPGTAGVYDYRVEVQSGNCASVYSSTYTITVYAASVGGSVTAAATQICLGASTGTITLSGHTGSVVRWERNIDGGGWTTIANTTTTHSETPGTAGSYQYRAVVKSGSCAETFSATHTITVNPLTVGGSVNGPNTQICLGESTGTMTLSGHTGSVVRWQRRLDGGGWINIANTTTTHSETPASQGLWEYRAELQSGSCAIQYSSIFAITVNPGSAGGTVSGTNTEICLGLETGIMTLSGHTGTIVKWQKQLNGGGWTDISNTNTTYNETPLTAGVWEYRAVVQSGLCPEAYSTAHIVTVYPVTVAGAVNGATTEICMGDPTGVMTLSGHIGSVVRWHKRVDGGVWTNITNTNATYSETPSGTGVWEYRAEVKSGTCANEFSTAHTITVYPATVAGSVTGVNSEICLGASTGTMTLGGYSGTITKWQRSIDGGAWQDIAHVAATYSETPAVAGAYQYRAAVQSGICGEAFSSAHSITVYPVTVGGSVSGATTEICLGASTGTMTLSGHTGSVVRWQKRVDAGVWTNVANTNATYSETPGTAGVWEYRAVLQSGTCSEVNSAIHTITVYPATVAGSVTGASTEICLGIGTGTLTLGGYTGNIVRWQKQHNGGGWVNIVNTAATYSEIPALAGVWEYRAVVQSGVCAEAFSAAHSITVHPVTVGGSVSGATTEICLGASTGTLTLSGHTGSVVRWERNINSGGWQNIANTSTTHSETPGIAGTYQYRALLQSGTCTNEYSSIHTITVYPATVAGSVTGASTEICLGIGTGTLTLGGYTGNIVRWQKQHNGGGWVNIVNTAATYSETPALAGVWEYRAVVQSGVCAEAFSAAHSITVHPVTVGGSVSGATTEICLGASTGTLTLSGHTGSVVRWERNINSGGWQNIVNTSTTHSETPGIAGTYQYRALLQSGTCANQYSSIHTITVYPATVAGSVTGASTEICLGIGTGTLTLGGHTGNIVRWQKQHNGGGWTNIVNTATTYSEIPALAGVWEYRAVVQSGVCTEVFSAAHSITVHPVTVGGSTSTGIIQIFIGQPTDNITLSGHTGSVVKWQKRHDGGPWTDIPFIGTVYSETPNLIGFWDYRAVVQSGVCSEEFSTSVQVEVLASQAGGVSGGNSPICLGSNTGIMTLTGYSGSIVRWEKRVDGGVWSSIAHTLDTYSEVPSLSGIWDYRAVVFTTIELFSAPATIEVNPLTVGGSLSGGSDVCLGNSTGTMTLSGHTGTILKWQRQYNGGGWVDISHTGATYSEVPALAGNYEYRAQVQSGVCAADFSTVHMLIIHPVTVGGSVTGVETEVCFGGNTGTLTLGGYTGSIVKWQVSFDGGAWTDISHTGATYSEVPATAGTYAYRAVVQSGSCGIANSSSHTITVHPATVAGAVTGATTEICLGASTGTLTLGGYTGAILNWQVSVDGGIWTDIPHTNPTYSTVPATAGIYAYRAVVQSGSCGTATSSAHTITVYPLVAGGIVTAAATEICLGQPTGTLTLSGHSGTIINWQVSVDGGAWTNIAHTNPTYSAVPGSAGTYAYRAVVQSGSCGTANSTAHTITVHPATVAGAVTGPNTEICLGASTGTLTLGGYTGTILNWQVSVDGGAWANIAHTNPTYSAVPGAAGTYAYRAVVKSGVCGEENSIEFSITVHPLVAGGNVTGAVTEICLGQPTGILTLSGHSGTIVKWQRQINAGGWVDIPHTGATYSEVPALAGTYEYRAQLESGSCGTAFSGIHTITVYPVTAGGSVSGVNTEICLGNTTGTLTLSGYTGTIVKWQKQLNGGGWADISHTGATYSEVPGTTGVWEYRAEVQSGICGTQFSSAHSITVYPVSVGGNIAGVNTEICVGSSTGAMTLSGHTGAIVRWERSIDGGAWQNIVNNTTTYSETPGTAGTYVYRAVIQSGVCNVTYSTTHTITVYPATVAGSVSGTLTELCLGANTGALTLSGHSGTIVKWQKQLNAGAWTDITNTTTTYSEVPSSAGTWNYRAVVQSGVCGQLESAMFTITVYPLTVGGTVAGPSTELCLGQTTGIMAVSGYTGSIVKWQVSYNGGIWIDIPHTGATYSETPGLAGTYSYRAQIQSGTCGTALSTVHTITVYPMAVGGTVNPGLTNIFLGDPTGTLTLSGHSGTITKWQKQHNGGGWVDITHTGVTYSETPALSGTWEYRAVVESGVCATQYSAIATVIVDGADPGTLSGGNSPICFGASTGLMSLTGYTGTIIRWEKSLDGGAWMPIAHTANFYFETPSAPGTWQYRAVVMGVSEMFSNAVTIVVDPPLNAGTLSGGGIICVGTSTPLMTLSGYSENIVKWEYRFNGGAWTDILHTGATYSEVPATAGLYEYRVFVESGSCGTAYSDVVSVTVDPALAAGVLTNGGVTICEGSQTPVLTLTAYSGSIVKWQKSDDGAIWTDISHTSNTYQEIPTSTGTWYYRVVVESGACGTANSTVQFVSVDPATDAGTLAGVNTQICIGSPTGLMSLSGYEGDIVQWQYRYDGGVWTNIAHTSSTYNETPLLAGTYEYRVEVQSGVCGAEYSNVWLIDVYPNVVAGVVDGSTSICEGSSTGILTLTAYTGSVIKWQKSDDGVNWTDIAHTADTYSEIPASVGVWHYRAEVESGTCGSAYSVAAIVTVDETTVAGVLSAVVTEICLGADTDVMTLVAYTGSIVKWQYRVNGGSWIDIAATNDVYTDTPASSGLYEYRVVVQNGVCDELTSNIVAINVHALPVAGILSASNTAICENESTGLMTVSGYTGSIVQWQKRINAGTWIDIAHTANTYSEVISTPGTWDFRVQIGNGACGSTNTNMVTIQVGSTTEPGIIDGNETEICLGESTDIMVVTAFTGSILGWQKRVNMGAWIDIPMSSSSTYTEVPNQAGTWHYRALVQSGSCASGYTDPYEIVVFAVPEAEFTYAITDYIVSFINTSSNATSYLWEFGDGNTSTEKHPIHTYTSSGMKTVTLTAYNGICEDEFTLTLSITVSVHEFDNDSYVTIYPNPSDNGNFNISFMVDGKYTEFDIVIYDVTGRIIYSENVSNITNGTVHPVTLTDTAAGAYRIRFVSTEGQFEKLLIIQ